MCGRIWWDCAWTPEGVGISKRSHKITDSRQVDGREYPGLRVSSQRRSGGRASVWAKRKANSLLLRASKMPQKNGKMRSKYSAKRNLKRMEHDMRRAWPWKWNKIETRTCCVRLLPPYLWSSISWLAIGSNISEATEPPWLCHKYICTSTILSKKSSIMRIDLS